MATMFQPTNGGTQWVICVDGALYYAVAPFTEFTKITGVSMSPLVDTVVGKQCLKSVNEDANGTLSIIKPKSILVIQDGSSDPVGWDGGTGRTLRIPVGLWMEWANSRLWIANENNVFAGNLADPESATENQYLAERSSFAMPAAVTGMIQTTDLSGLLVFTANTTTTLQSGIRTRTQWQATPNFQNLLLPNIGCIAGKSAINVYGLTVWFSANGLVSLNAAQSSRISSVLPTIDAAMMRSKALVTGNTAGVCCGHYENIMLVSVPCGSRYNAHTWVRDEASLGLGDDAAIWSGVWTGIRPVEWATISSGNRQRCFVASYDQTTRDGTKIHFWEAFSPDRVDNRTGRIRCQHETALVLLPSRRKFCYAELDLCEILGRVDLQVYVGGLKGPWIKVLDTTLTAEEGSIGSGSQIEITSASILQGFKPQSRRIRTRDFSPQNISCVPESGDAPGVDKAMGLLMVWKGRMGVQRARLTTSPFSESDTGNCSESELGKVSAINYAGEPVTP